MDQIKTLIQALSLDEKKKVYQWLKLNIQREEERAEFEKELNSDKKNESTL